MPDRPAALFVMDPRHLGGLFPPELRQRLAAVLRIPDSAAPEPTPAGGVALDEVEVLVTGWGCAPLTGKVLAGLPRLRAVLHAAGSVKGHLTAACWDRGTVVSSAAAANARPVAEFALGAILLAAKDAFGLRARYAAGHRLPGLAETAGVGGNGSRVGIVGASRTGRSLITLLRPFGFEVAVHDPYLSPDEAAELGVLPLGLDELVATSRVLSLHAPDLPATRGLLDARRLALMPDGATLVNTARGALVDTGALTAELVDGRLSAVLDVTDPEPLPPGSPLFSLPRVLLTPHIAGALGNELALLGAVVVQEAERLLEGAPLRHPVLRADLDRSA